MKRKTHLFISFLLSSLICSTAIAQTSPVSPNQSQQSTQQSIFGGYTSNFLSSPDASPYQIVTAQDVYPLVVGYGLSKAPLTAGNFDPKSPQSYMSQYDAPFVINAPTSSQYSPNIYADSSIGILTGSMLMGLPKAQLTRYLRHTDAAFQAPQLTNATSFNNNSVANINGGNSYDYIITSDFSAPYNPRSLFHYVSSSNQTTASSTPPAYQKNPAEVYMALTSGALTPLPYPDNPTADFTLQMRRFIASQNAGIYALQQIFERSKPLNGFNANVLKQLNSNFPDSKQAQPNSARDLEKFMASRRLDPASGWYQHLQQATPTELQREQLYLQAETLYELQKIHETEEQNQMLLAVMLLSQNYNSQTLNAQNPGVTPGS